MRAKGLPYYPTLVQAVSAEYLAKSLPEFPPYASIAARRAGGYGLFEKFRDDPGGHPAKETSYLSHLGRRAISRYFENFEGGRSARIHAAYPNGLRGTIQDGGCLGNSESKVFGSALDYAEAVTGLGIVQIDFVEVVEATMSFKLILRNWSLCMKGHGFSYSSPISARSKLESQYEKQGANDALRQKENAVAVADARCASATAMQRHTYALQDAAASNLTGHNKRYLLRYDAIFDKALRRARRLAAGA